MTRIERLERFPDSGSFTPDEWLNQQVYKMVVCEKHVGSYTFLLSYAYDHLFSMHNSDHCIISPVNPHTNARRQR